MVKGKIGDMEEQDVDYVQFCVIIGLANESHHQLFLHSLVVGVLIFEVLKTDAKVTV